MPGLTASEHRMLDRRRRRRRLVRGLAFLAPNLVFFTLFLAVPVAWLAISTFQSGGVYGSTQFVGLENWRDLPSDPLVVKAGWNTLLIAALSIPALGAFGLGLALLLRSVRRGRSVFSAALYVPTLAPLVIVAAVWLFLVHPDFGGLNVGVRALGGETVNWLGSTTLARTTIVMVEVWRGMGFWALFFLAALLALPSELYEAARLDGASSRRRLTRLTIPLLRPRLTFFVAVAVFIAFQTFDTVFIMTDGGPANSTATVVWYIFKSIFVYDQAGLGATLSLLLLGVILAMTLIVLRLIRPKWQAD